jgi:hypothetical protein
VNNTLNITCYKSAPKTAKYEGKLKKRGGSQVNARLGDARSRLALLPFFLIVVVDPILKIDEEEHDYGPKRGSFLIRARGRRRPRSAGDEDIEHDDEDEHD